MSSGRPNNAGIYNFDNLNAQNLFIRGVPFQDYIDDLVAGDQFEQGEIDEIRQIIQYLNTTGLTTEWVVENTNINATLKTAIDTLTTKLTYLDTTALTQSWVVDNDNRNATLKTRIDSNDTKMQYVTSVQGNDGTSTASTFLVGINDRIKRQLSLSTGTNSISSINNSSTMGSTGNYADNRIVLQAANGQVWSYGHLNTIEAIDKIEIGSQFGVGAQTAVNIGARNNRINIGSIDSPEVGLTTTEITIGKRTVSKNTDTTLQGNFYTGDARWESLTKSSALTWTQLLSLVSTSGLPLWVASFALTSSIPNFSYSDLWSMKAVEEAGGLIKNGELETTKGAKLKTLTVFDTEVGVDIVPKEGTFFAKGHISKTTLLGDIKMQTFNGEINLINNNISPSNINWALTEAGDNVNSLKISNNDVELIAGAGADGSQLRISNTTGGPIKLRVGTGKLQANAHDALNIYNSQATSQVQIGNANTLANRYDTTSKVIIDHTQLTDGLKVCKATDGANPGKTARLNHNNLSCQSFTFQDDYDLIGTNNVFEKTLYTTQNGSKLFYWGEQIYPPLNTQTTVGGGITYLINNPTTVTNASPAPTITMTAAYTSAATTSIIRTGYTVGLNHLLTTIKSEYIPSLGNTILSGVYEANLWAAYTGHNPANLKAKLFYVGETTDITGFSLINKNYTNSAGSGTLQAIKTKAINVPQTVFQGFFGNITGFLSTDLLNVIFPSVTVTTAGTVTLACTLKNNSGSVLYTFQSISGATSGTSDRTFLCVTSPTPATVTAESLTNFFFEIAITSGTGTISQASARNANDANYTFNGRVRYLLYDGTFNPTSLTENSTNLYALSLPVQTCDTTEFTTFSKIQTEIYFSQVSGSNSNHEIALLFNDGNLSHMHTNITPAGGAGNPTLASVLATSNSAGANEINMNGNAIRGISALIPVSGPSWTVRSLSAGSGISITNDGAGTFTISHSFPEPACVLWFSGQQNQTTNLYPIVDFTSVGKIDLNNYNIEYEVDITWDRQPSGYNGTFMLLGLNTHINTTYDVNNASTTWDRAIENGGDVSVFDQTFRRRFFCGFNGSHGSGNNYRYRTLLKGTLCMFRRTTGQTTNLDSYPDPITSSSRVVNNRFYCDNMVNEILSTNSSKFFESSSGDFGSGQSTINGAANWEMHYDNVWNTGLSNAPVNGIYSLVFYLFDLFNTAQNRSFNSNFKIWRVKKV